MNITKETSVEELLNSAPGLAKTFIKLGLPCLVCGQAFWGTIEELARQNNIPVEKILKELNRKIRTENEVI